MPGNINSTFAARLAALRCTTDGFVSAAQFNELLLLIQTGQITSVVGGTFRTNGSSRALIITPSNGGKTTLGAGTPYAVDATHIGVTAEVGYCGSASVTYAGTPSAALTAGDICLHWTFDATTGDVTGVSLFFGTALANTATDFYQPIGSVTSGGVVTPTKISPDNAQFYICGSVSYISSAP
jgi:hypothetical protein